MDKAYDHNKESEIYKAWEDSGAMAAPEKENGKKTFTIIMPPPNANDPLHVGHAMFVTIEDILIRYHRMRGEDTLWLPGTDHAGIETQFVFEKKLSKEGKSRFDYDRETLYQMILEYVQGNSGVAIEQMKKLGASADWGRFKFTLDQDIVKEVVKTFTKLNEDGLIYRGERLVNYCVFCGTAYSELEVEYEDRNSPLYYVKYPFVDEEGFVSVATVRPEPIFADTHLAVNPKDKKRKKLIGKKVRNPLTDEEMTIIGDEMVDPSFGTGIVKLTPAHDQNDWEVAERHSLARNQAIDMKGRITEMGGKYAGMKVNEARTLVVEDLKAKGLIEKIDEKYMNRVATCYRCHRNIEPLPMKQFFIRVKPLAEAALKALDNKETVVLGAGREKILRHWLNNLRDWNISRQIVWGIRMPVWYKGGDKEDYVVSESSPGEEYEQETDTFDTWFSSGQWPVVTLKTNRAGDFEHYYPTSVMETGYDILPFWVMRMMLLGIYMTGKSPFKYVYLHGLVRDEQGRKMSKSIGNVINPVMMVEKYGADAIRMALVMNSTPGVDKNVGETQIRGMRNFANKIWNGARFVMMLEDKGGEEKVEGEFKQALKKLEENMTQQMEKMGLGLAAEEIYSWFWHQYCDVYIEMSKEGKISKQVMLEGLKRLMIMLHPFVPFVTEAVWKELGEKQLLIETKWVE